MQSIQHMKSSIINRSRYDWSFHLKCKTFRLNFLQFTILIGGLRGWNVMHSRFVVLAMEVVLEIEPLENVTEQRGKVNLGRKKFKIRREILNCTLTHINVCSFLLLWDPKSHRRIKTIASVTQGNSPRVRFYNTTLERPSPYSPQSLVIPISIVMSILRISYVTLS
jgi:hypothetical protein